MNTVPGSLFSRDHCTQVWYRYGTGSSPPGPAPRQYSVLVFDRERREPDGELVEE